MVRDPKIGGGADDFFAAVVEVVAEGPDLRFEFEHAEQSLLVDDDGIPVLGCPEEPRQRDLASIAMDGIGGESAMRGDATNLKVTYPADLALAAMILRARK